MGFKFEGFKELQRNLQKAQDSIPKDNQIPLTDLFTPKFMKKYTSFNSIDEMFSNSPFDVSSNEAFEAIPQQELDKYVRENTRFQNWEGMLSKASELYLENLFKF